MRIVIASDKFKGSATGSEVATALAAGIAEVLPHADDAFGTSRVRFEGGHEASVSSGAIYKGRCRRCQPAAAAPASTPLTRPDRSNLTESDHVAPVRPC